MNYFHNFLLFIFFIASIFNLYPASVYSISASQELRLNEKGLPLIRNYLPNEYGADDQNWSIIQDKDGLMYFGNNYGILIFNGHSWSLISIPNEIVRSLAMDYDGRIYVGGNNEIGYLTKAANGKPVYHSLTHYLPKSDRKFGHVWNALYCDSAVYFQSYTHIIRIHYPLKDSLFLQEKDIRIWHPKTNFHLSFVVDNHYYVLQQNRGLFTIAEDSLRMVQGGEFFAGQTIFLMQPWVYKNPGSSPKVPDKILIYAKPSGFLVYDGKTFSPVKTEADDYLQKNILYTNSSLLADGTLALGTVHGGLVLLNHKGEINQIITPQEGLADPTIYATYADKSGNLWLALQNGITRLNLNLPFTVFDNRLGIDSEVNSIIRFKGKLYCATIRGARKLEAGPQFKNKFHFLKIPGIALQSWDLLEANGHLLVATTDGVAEIINNQANPIPTSWHNALSLFHSKKAPATIFVGLLDGLARLTYYNGSWHDYGRLKGITEDVRYICEDSLGNLWLGTMMQKVIKVTISDDSSFHIQRFDGKGKIKGYYSLFKQGNYILVAINQGFLRYDAQFDDFIQFQYLPFHYQDPIRRTFQLFSDSEKRIWIQEETMAGSKIFTFKNGHLNELRILQIISDRKLGRKIYQDTDQKNIFWIAGAKSIVRLDINKIEKWKKMPNFPLIFTSITINNDSTINIEKDMGQIIHEFKFSFNTITFDYALPGTIDESATLYQYFLEGFNSRWSKWSSQNSKTFEQLPPGNYLFKVRAQDAFGHITVVKSFAFKILPPWYRAWWVWPFYLLFLILIIYMTLYSRLLYLKHKAIKLENIVEERTQKIREQSEKLKEMERLKSQFFANITHEFRTPLTLIKGQIESLLASHLGDKEKHKLKMAERNTRRLQQLINQLLDLAKIESQSLKLNYAAHDLIPILRGMVYSFESLAKQKRISLNFYSKEEKLVFEFDTEKIEEVFENLLSNALKFTPQGGAISVTVQQADTEDEYTVESNEKFVEIHVKDTGIGIPSDKLKHIFDRFYQADSSKTRSFEGTGLGLALVKEMVELHQGYISVRSEPDLGTDFKIVLPLRKQRMDVETIQSSQDELQKAFAVAEDHQKEKFNSNNDQQKHKETILIVEDNRDMCTYLRQCLEIEFNIKTAIDGNEGLKTAEKLMPDLIISDVMMPMMDGFELVKRLRQSEKTSHIPIILLTARSSLEDKIDGIESGADAYLVKPFNNQELLARVKSLIQTRRMLRQRFSRATVIRPKEISALSTDQAFLEKIVSIIEAHMGDENFSVETLAQEAAFSVTHLNRKLRALIEQSAGQLIRSLRLQRAADLINKRAGNIAEIAMMVGFSDQTSFTRSFKRQFGIPPSAYYKKKN